MLNPLIFLKKRCFIPRIHNPLFLMVKLAFPKKGNRTPRPERRDARFFKKHPNNINRFEGKDWRTRPDEKGITTQRGAGIGIPIGNYWRTRPDEKGITTLIVSHTSRTVEAIGELDLMKKGLRRQSSL